MYIRLYIYTILVVMVDRSSPIPAYYQIAVDIHQRIANGEWRAGDKIPPEIDLAEGYEVSRMTMRKALGQLANEGILDRKPGNGTFVNLGYLDFTGFSYQKQLQAVIDEGKKNALRDRVWEKLREVARPDSRFHWDFREFVPDFEGSGQCAKYVKELKEFQEADIIFAAPDNSLKRIRRLVIEEKKILLMATYAIKRGFMILKPEHVPPGDEAWAASLDGMETFGQPISLNGIQDLGKVDLMVTGISLVSEKGTRWGKGHGFFDLEWAMFREISVVDEQTPIIAVAHDCQVISTGLQPSSVDTVVDLIVTPTRKIFVEKIYTKPQGIIWEYITPDLKDQIPPLQELYKRSQA